MDETFWGDAEAAGRFGNGLPKRVLSVPLVDSSSLSCAIRDKDALFEVPSPGEDGGEESFDPPESSHPPTPGIVIGSFDVLGPEEATL